MALSNSQFNDLMKRYDERQIERERELDARQKRLYDVIPSLRSLDDDIRDAYINMARVELKGGDVASVKNEIASLEAKKVSLFKENGFPENYLDVPYTCNDCKDKGIVEGVKCHCFIKASNALLFHQSNMEKRLQKTFSDFSIDCYEETKTDITGGTSRQSAEAALNAARKFVENFPDKSNFFIFGDTGTGKTHLACCIATEIINKGYSAVFVKTPEFIDLCYQRFNDKTGEKGAMYERLFDCDLLVLDDLGADYSTRNTPSLVLTLIDERLNSGLSTVITSNLDISQIRDIYSERVSSRIIGDYKNFHFFGSDHRIKC